MPDSTTYEFACGDIMDGCDATFRGTHEELFAQISAHARDVHGIDPVPQSVADQVEQRMRAVG